MNIRTRGYICIREEGTQSVASKLHVHFLDSGFVKSELVAIPEGYAPHPWELTAHVRISPPEGAQGPVWTVLVPEDLSRHFTLARELALSFKPSVPVVAVRFDFVGKGVAKLYFGDEVLVKAGDDPDHEVSFPIPRLNALALDRALELLNEHHRLGDETKGMLLKGLSSSSTDGLEKALSLLGISLPRETYRELVDAPFEKGRHEIYVHKRSRLISGGTP